MARDKAKDDIFFNCSQEYEHRYVYNLYVGNEDSVKSFLIQKCNSGTIKYDTHLDVYKLIQKELKLPIPV